MDLLSRAGKPTDNPVNEALNGWIKEELYAEFHLEQYWHRQDFINTIERYVKYYNPCCKDIGFAWKSVEPSYYTCFSHLF